MSLQLNQFSQSTVQGMVDQIGFGSNVTAAIVKSTQAVALIPGQPVQVADEATAVPSVVSLTANSDVTDGFVCYTVKDASFPANARLELALGGTVMYMTAGAAIARWAAIEVVYTTNKVITSAGTNPVVGFAFDKAAANGDLIRVYIENASEVATSIGSISGLQAALNALQAPVLPYEVETDITTVGSGVLTAAGLVGKLIKRTGPVAAFSDATDSALNIVAALNTYVAASSFETKIQNFTLFPMTITAGSGVTLTGNIIVPPLSVATYLVTITNGTAVAIKGIAIAPITTAQPEVITALTTVGAGTITGAGIAGGVTNRTGSTSAFTDTTDTAANIIAAIYNGVTGSAFEYTYFNNTGFVATLAAGSSVTLTGVTVLPATWMRFHVRMTSSSAVTMTPIATGPIGALPPAQYATGTTTTTFTAGELTGAAFTVYNNSGATPGSIATRTATQMIADIGNAHIGQTWVLRVKNGQATGDLTMTAGADVTLTGTAVVTANTFNDYVCTVTSIALHTITIQYAGSGVNT